MGLSTEEALALMPKRTNITLESYDMANMGGDLVALAIQSLIFLALVILIEIGICRCKCRRAAKA